PPNEQNKTTALLVHHNTTEYKLAEEDLRKTNSNFTQQLQQMHSGFWTSNSLLIDLMNHVEQMERRLRESELRFHLLAENATDVISRHTADGTWLYVSPACKMSLGFNPEELIGKNLYKLIHNDDQTKIKKIFSRRRETTNNKPLVYRIKRKEGE